MSKVILWMAAGGLFGSLFLVMVEMTLSRLTSEPAIHVTKSTLAVTLWVDILAFSTALLASNLSSAVKVASNLIPAFQAISFCLLCLSSAMAFLFSTTSDFPAASRAVILILSAGSLYSVLAAILRTQKKNDSDENESEESPLLNNTENTSILSAKSLAFHAILLVIAFGIVIRVLREFETLHKFSPPGVLIPLSDNTWKLHIHCTGPPRSSTQTRFSPTILLETGLAVTSTVSWKFIINDLSQVARVCYYDRAGYGWSESGPMPQTAKRNALTLHDLLSKAKEPGPFILVGHSFGGYIILYPEKTAGLVFLDASHEDSLYSLNNTELFWKMAMMNSFAGIFISPFANFDRLLVDHISHMQGVNYSESDIATSIRGKFFKAVSSELLNFGVVSGNQARNSKPRYRLGIPVTVLTSGKAVSPYCIPKRSKCEVRDGVDVSDPAVLLAKNWFDCQKDLATSLSFEAEHVFAENAGHYVMFDEPGIVVEVVIDVYKKSQGFAGMTI